MTKILVELQITENEEQLFIDWLVKNHIKHNIYAFEIGNIGSKEDKK